MQIKSNTELTISLPVSIVKDKDLSLQAIGILAVLSSERLYEVSNLVTYSEAIDTQVKSTLKELIAKGYLVKSGDTWNLVTTRSTLLSNQITTNAKSSFFVLLEELGIPKGYALKLVSAYNREMVLEALQKTLEAKPLDPKSYLAGTLRRMSGQTQSEQAVLEDY